MVKRAFVLLFLLFMTSAFVYSAVVDGTLDFAADAEWVTSSNLWTNFIEWDTQNLFIGYLGEDIDAGDSGISFCAAISTNTSTGSAYLPDISGVSTVIPFRADLLVRYRSDGVVSCAGYDGSSWQWNDPVSFTWGVTIATNGNVLEFSIASNLLSGTEDLSYWGSMISATGRYGLAPATTATDFSASHPSNFIAYGSLIWDSSVDFNDPALVSYDSVLPSSNALIVPANAQSNVWGESVSFSNYASDAVGVTMVEFYTNETLHSTVRLSNEGNWQVWTVDTSSWNAGTFRLFTKAYDTYGSVVSATNEWTVLSSPDLSVQKSVDHIEWNNTNWLLPGSLVVYRIDYSNLGEGYATNVVMMDRIPEHTHYYTNYSGATTSGWEVQFSSLASPDQSYASSDYTLSTNSALWIRFRKARVDSDEDGKSLYIGVTVD